MTKRFSVLLFFLPFIFVFGSGSSAQNYNEYPNYSKTWVGNTFGKEGDRSWGQNYISAITVGNNGRVYTNSQWDEARGHTAIYENGAVVNICDNNRGIAGHSGAINSTRLFLGRDKLVQVYNLDGDNTGKPFDIGYTPSGLGANDSILMVTSNSDNRVDIFRITDRSLIKTMTVSSPGAAAVSKNGKMWVVKNVKSLLGDWGTLHWEAAVSGSPTIVELGPQGQVLREIPGYKDWLPVSLTFDNLGRLLLADEGVGYHILRFFDVSGTPKQVHTFGTLGGIGAGIAGEVTPTKFWGLAGAGTDSQGNIYVAQSQQGTIIRSFSPEGTLRWEVMGLAFCDNGDFVPGSDGLEIYSAQEHYTLDFSKAKGQHWNLSHYTVNRDKYPEDIRLSPAWGPTVVRKIKGKLFLFVSYFKNTKGIYSYKFNYDTDGYIAIPSGRLFGDFSGRPDWYVDDSGDVWFIDGLKIGKWPCTGINTNGDLTYGSAQYYTIPNNPYKNQLGNIEYDRLNDAMYIGGGTADNPLVGCCHSGPVLSRYDNWSAAPQLRWRIAVPFNNDQSLSESKKVVPQGLAVAGEKLFVIYQNFDDEVNPEHGMSGVIRVYDNRDGTWLGRLYPPAAQGSWVDIVGGGGINAVKRNNGEIVVIREENWKAKHIIFRVDTPTITSAADKNPHHLVRHSATDTDGAADSQWFLPNGKRITLMNPNHARVREQMKLQLH